LERESFVAFVQVLSPFSEFCLIYCFIEKHVLYWFI